MPAADYHNYARKVETAARRVDLDATDAQREAGNARVGKAYVHGLELAIERPKGSVRTGTAADGTTWSRRMQAHYGRINRTVGRDGEAVDVFLGDHPKSQLVFVVSQLHADGNLDEHKCMLGYTCHPDAKAAYLAHYPDNWERTRLGEIRGMLMDEFKQWLVSDAPKKTPTRKRAHALADHPDPASAALVATLARELGFG